MRALSITEFGDVDVLQYNEVHDPILSPNGLIVRTKAIGLNYSDIYRRRGNYVLEGEPPYILGYEGAGVVEAVGEVVKRYKVGDRVGFADVPFANAEKVFVPEEKVIPLPEKISFETAASTLLQGLTADFLVNDSFKVESGHKVVIHAVSGGVGQLLLQMVKNKGAHVIGLTSSPKKKVIAESLGADKVILRTKDWKKEILDCTHHEADVVYDAVGSTLTDSFDVVKTGGTVVFYGTAGGDPEPFNPKMLIGESKTLTGGGLWKMVSTQEDRLKRSERLFQSIIEGEIKLSPPTSFSLSNGAEGHRLLESGKSTGKIIFLP